MNNTTLLHNVRVFGDKRNHPPSLPLPQKRDKAQRRIKEGTCIHRKETKKKVPIPFTI